VFETSVVVLVGMVAVLVVSEIELVIAENLQSCHSDLKQKNVSLYSDPEIDIFIPK